MRPISRAFAAVALAATAATGTGTVEASTPDGVGDEESTEIELDDARILALSPNGRLLAAGSEERGGGQLLCVHDVATGAVQACGDLAERDIDFAVDTVVWSPDSAQLAFAEVALQLLADGDIWVMDAASGELTNVTDDGSEGEVPRLGEDDAESTAGPVYIDIVPTWAPDSRAVTFSRSPYVDGEWAGTEIASVELATGDIEVLTTVTTDGLAAVWMGMEWTADGRRLYYTVDTTDGDDPENGLWELDRDTGESRRIVTADVDKGPPAVIEISATGTTALVFYPRVYQRNFGTGEDTYELIDLETQERSKLHPATESAAGGVAAMATFSPDGTRLLYSLTSGDQSELVVRRLPDGEPEIVVTGIDARPVPWTLGGGLFWADDGTVIVPTDTNVGAVLHLDPAG